MNTEKAMRKLLTECRRNGMTGAEIKQVPHLWFILSEDEKNQERIRDFVEHYEVLRRERRWR